MKIKITNLEQGNNMTDINSDKSTFNDIFKLLQDISRRLGRIEKKMKSLETNAKLEKIYHFETSEKKYLTETEASVRYGYSKPWFQHERWKKTGPIYCKNAAGKILYPVKETDEWFNNKYIYNEKD